MRTISAATQAVLDTPYTVETIPIVQFQVAGITKTYVGKVIEGITQDGFILSISPISEETSINSTTSAVSIELDDSDGVIKNIFDYNDLHKAPINIYRYVVGTPAIPENLIVMMEGEINTPIIWSEKKRTLQISALTKIESQEVGISLEEADISNLPYDIVGKAIPLIFGTVLRVEGVKLTKEPNVICARGFGRINEFIYEQELAELARAAFEAFNNFVFSANLATALNTKANTYIDGIESAFNPPDNIETANQLFAQSAQYNAQANAFYDTSFQLNGQSIALREEFEEKRRFVSDVIELAGDLIPQEGRFTVEINGYYFLVQREGNSLRIIEDLYADEEYTVLGRRPRDGIQPLKLLPLKRPSMVLRSLLASEDRFDIETNKLEKFRWIDGGSKINFLSNVNIIYAGCIDGTLLGVFGRSKGILIRIPNTYYTLESFQVGNVTLACIRLNVQLSSLRNGEGSEVFDDDKVYFDIRGRDPAYTSIINYISQTYTNLTLDDSINQVRNLSAGNFAYFDRTNAIKFIQDLSFQFNVAVWVKGRKLHFKQLNYEYDSTATLTPDDVDNENSITISGTSSDEIRTKLVAEWISVYNQPEPHLLIGRINILKYGTIEERYNYFAMTNGASIRESLTFWGLRLGNTWKILNFQTYINNVKIEVFDTILLSNFNRMFCNTDVKGIVLNSTLDPENNLISLEVWIPVRLGEMDIYRNAYPIDARERLYTRDNRDVQTGSPIFGQPLSFPVFRNGSLSLQVGNYNIFDDTSGQGRTPSEQAFEGSVANAIALSSVSVDFDRPANLLDANRRSVINIPKALDFLLPDPPISGVELGFIREYTGTGNTYLVELFNGDGTTVQVNQLLHNPTFPIAVSTPVMIATLDGVRYMQAPVWMDEPIEEEEL